MTLTPNTAAAAGYVQLGDLTVPRLGFGAMRLPGPGIWGPPADHDEAIRVVRRAVESGIRLIDTAWYYGFDVANEIIAEAIHPYPANLVLVTKLGGSRREDASWHPAMSPGELRAGNERDRRVLGVDSVPVTHLRWMDQPRVSFEEALGAMVEMRAEGLIERIGVSNVSLEQLEIALTTTEIVSVSNHFGPTSRPTSPSWPGASKRASPICPTSRSLAVPSPPLSRPPTRRCMRLPRSTVSVRRRLRSRGCWHGRR